MMMWDAYIKTVSALGTSICKQNKEATEHLSHETKCKYSTWGFRAGHVIMLSRCCCCSVFPAERCCCGACCSVQWACSSLASFEYHKELPLLFLCRCASGLSCSTVRCLREREMRLTTLKCCAFIAPEESGHTHLDMHASHPHPVGYPRWHISPSFS